MSCGQPANDKPAGPARPRSSWIPTTTWQLKIMTSRQTSATHSSKAATADGEHFGGMSHSDSSSGRPGTGLGRREAEVRSQNASWLSLQASGSQNKQGRRAEGGYFGLFGHGSWESALGGVERAIRLKRRVFNNLSIWLWKFLPQICWRINIVVKLEWLLAQQKRRNTAFSTVSLLCGVQLLTFPANIVTFISKQ